MLLRLMNDFFLAGINMLTQQLQTGRIDMPSFANTLKDSGAVDLTLVHHNADNQKEEGTRNGISVGHGLLTLAQVNLIHELPKGTLDTKL